MNKTDENQMSCSAAKIILRDNMGKIFSKR